jgi:hypothetical protein
MNNSKQRNHEAGPQCKYYFFSKYAIKSIPSWTITYIVQDVVLAMWGTRESMSIVSICIIVHLSTTDSFGSRFYWMKCQKIFRNCPLRNLSGRLSPPSSARQKASATMSEMRKCKTHASTCEAKEKGEHEICPEFLWHYTGYLQVHG